MLKGAASSPRADFFVSLAGRNKIHLRHHAQSKSPSYVLWLPSSQKWDYSTVLATEATPIKKHFLYNDPMWSEKPTTISTRSSGAMSISPEAARVQTFPQKKVSLVNLHKPYIILYIYTINIVVYILTYICTMKLTHLAIIICLPFLDLFTLHSYLSTYLFIYISKSTVLSIFLSIHPSACIPT